MEKMRVDLNQAPWVKCSDNNIIFDKKIMFKRISPILSPSGKEEFIPIEAIVCEKCGKIPAFFHEKMKDIPDDLKSDCTF